MQNLSSASNLVAGMGAYNRVMGGVAGYQSAMANAQIADTNAQYAQIDGAVQTAQSDARYRAAIGEQLAAQGGSGFSMGTGSMLDAITASRINQTLAALDISRQAQARAIGYQNAAASYRATGMGKLLSSITTASSSLINTGMDYANQFHNWGYDTDPTDPAAAIEPMQDQSADTGTRNG